MTNQSNKDKGKKKMEDEEAEKEHSITVDFMMEKVKEKVMTLLKTMLDGIFSDLHQVFVLPLKS